MKKIDNKKQLFRLWGSTLLFLFVVFTTNAQNYSTTFESGFGDWSQESNEDFDWTRHWGTTASSNTGPIAASEGTYYIYTEASIPNHPSKTATITSIPYALGSNGTFRFDLHMYGATMEQLTLSASSDGGSTWQSIWSLQGDQGNSWNTIQVDLSNYAASTVQFRFTGITGSSFTGDISIDNIQITSIEPSRILSNENYIYTVQPQVATTAISNLGDDEKTESVAYFDGLGRAKQQIALRAGGNLEDIITHIEYDAFGRQAKDYLPFAELNNAGMYTSSALSETTTFYNSHYSEDLAGGTASNPYSEKHFEASPLNRVLEQGAPGADWAVDKINDTDHTIKFEYLTNTATEEVLLYQVSLSATDNTYTPTLTGGTSCYGAGQLYKTVTKDEQWQPGQPHPLDHTTEEFKDKQGRVVLKRTFNTNISHDTYYVYDDYGNLSYVLPPLVNTSDGISSTELTELSYQYQYDHRNRLVQKKIPGKAWEYIIYDKLDRPVLTQDAHLRGNKQWLFTKYDVFGRVIYTGIYRHADTLNQSEMQAHYHSAPTNAYSARLPYEEKRTIEFASTYVSHYYSTLQFPFEQIEILSVNYYDDYAFNTAGLHIPTTVLNAQVSTRTKTLATGARIKVLNPNPEALEGWITTTNAYDEKARPIWTATHNAYLETTDIVKSEIDFVGKLDQSISIHSKTGQDTIVVQDTYTYDHVGRPLGHSQSIANSEAGLGQNKELIALNSYDALGQLISKKVGGTVAEELENSPGLQTIDYTYNIRGWLKNINEDANEDQDLFNFTLAYNSPTEGTPLYNGNISQTRWNTLSENPGENPVSTRYNYAYDALNRISSALDNTGNYMLSGIRYDKNGNILALSRQGPTNVNATTFGVMDALNYSYDGGNKLLSLSDTGTKSTGFKDNADLTTEYTYDANGNMTQDKNKGITAIAYNHLNLPIQVSFGSNNISYIYDAAGIKLAKVVEENGIETHTAYAGNFVYNDNVLQFFNSPEGYYSPPPSGVLEGDYVYQYKDHLGNVRLSYTEIDTPLFFEDFESAEGWDGTGNTWGHPITEFDSSFTHNGTFSGRVNTGNLDSAVHSTEWITIDNSAPTEYTYSCWAYSDSPVIRLALFMKEEGETAYLTLVDEIIKTNTTGQWIYLERTVLVPAHIKTLNIRIAASNWGDGIGNVWFDDISIRQVDVAPVLEIVEENNYYPFGLLHKGYNNVVNGTAHPYKFGGKEHNQELGLDWYDFGARNYDASLGRWMNLDPLAEQMRRHSPYNYAFNNPLRFTDPDGMAPLDIIVENTETNTITRVKNDDATDTWVKDGKTTETGLSKSQSAGRIAHAASDGTTTNEATIKYGADADASKVSNYSTSVLVDVMNETGNNSIQINSTARTPEEQARVMSGLVDDNGMADTKALYGKNGELVLDQHPDQKAMVSKMNELGPSNVSKHIADPSKMNVVDVSPWRAGIKRPKAFASKALKHKGVSRVLSPYNSRDKAIHIEIPQPQK